MVSTIVESGKPQATGLSPAPLPMTCQSARLADLLTASVGW